MTLSLQDPFEQPQPHIEVEDILFNTSTSSLQANPSAPSIRFPPIITQQRKRSRSNDHELPAMLSRDKTRQDNNNFRPLYKSASIGQVQFNQRTIPKKSSVGIHVAPFNMNTHAKDKQEFGSVRFNNDVAAEYHDLCGVDHYKPKSKIAQQLQTQRMRKQEIFTPNKTAKVSGHQHCRERKLDLNKTAPSALQSISGTSSKRLWTQNNRYALKSTTPTPSRIITKSNSDGPESFPKSIVTERRTISLTTSRSSDRPKSSPATIRHRPGSTVENPVELSDDDEDEIEEREIAVVWDGLSTDIAIGQIWLGKCRLVCHGPSRLRLDLTSDTNRKNFTIELTPYLIERIPVADIVSTKLYLRLGGGCTFLSVLVHEHHQWGLWAKPYKYRDRLTEPVWITMFFGASTQRQALENTAWELPAFEEVVCPSDHLDIIGQGLIDQYPCRTSRLDMESRINRKKASKQVVCKYPERQRDCVTITNGDLESLDPHEFLNDTVIDFKLAHLRLHDLKPKIDYHVFSSFFYKRFVTSNMSYDSVKRWTDKLDLFQKDFWLIPICESLHWTLAVICYPNTMQSDQRQPVMLYYDSLGGSGRRAFEIIKKYITAALKQPNKRLRLAEFVYKIETDFQLIDVQVPKQTNSYDCGIYLLLFAEYFMKSPPVDVCSPHEPEWFDRSVADAHRYKIRDEILRIAYRQSPGNPEPVSTDYVKVPTYINDDDIDAVITIDDISDIGLDDTEAIIVES